MHSQRSSAATLILISIAFVGVCGMLCYFVGGSILAKTPPNPSGMDWAFAVLPVLIPMAAVGFSGAILGQTRTGSQREKIQTAHIIGLAVGEFPFIFSMFAVGRAWPIWFALTAMVFTAIVLTHRSMNLLAVLEQQG